MVAKPVFVRLEQPFRVLVDLHNLRIVLLLELLKHFSQLLHHLRFSSAICLVLLLLRIFLYGLGSRQNFTSIGIATLPGLIKSTLGGAPTSCWHL